MMKIMKRKAANQREDKITQPCYVRVLKRYRNKKNKITNMIKEQNTLLKNLRFTASPDLLALFLEPPVASPKLQQVTKAPDH